MVNFKQKLSRYNQTMKKVLDHLQALPNNFTNRENIKPTSLSNNSQFLQVEFGTYNCQKKNQNQNQRHRIETGDIFFFSWTNITS